jgi:hypothetical protein
MFLFVRLLTEFFLFPREDHFVAADSCGAATPVLYFLYSTWYLWQYFPVDSD